MNNDANAESGDAAASSPVHPGNVSGVGVKYDEFGKALVMVCRVLGDDRQWYRHKYRWAVQTRLDEYEQA